MLWYKSFVRLYLQRLLLQYHFVGYIVFFLLPQFELAKKFFLSSRRIIDVEKNFRDVLNVPVVVLADVVHVLGINNAIIFELCSSFG